MTSRLRTARIDRGWSQARLIYELHRCAQAHGIGIMTAPSLRTAISRWENGHVLPDHYYRRLLRDIYGLSDAEMGLAPTATTDVDAAEGQDELRTRIIGSTHVDADLVELLRSQTDTIRRLDRRLGAPVVLAQMQTHIDTLRDLLHNAVLDSAREPIATVLADASALAGWQSLDCGLTSKAWHHHEVAKNAARLAGDPSVLAFAKGEQAYVLLDLDRPHQAVSLVREVRAEVGRAPPATDGAWLWAAEAETAAAAGERDACKRALDRASATLPDGPTTAPDLPYLALDRNHLARWRGSALARLGDPEAVEQLSTALTAADPAFHRARSGLLVDLAQALTAADARDVAAPHIAEATELATMIGSVRQRRRLTQLAA